HTNSTDLSRTEELPWTVLVLEEPSTTDLRKSSRTGSTLVSRLRHISEWNLHTTVPTRCTIRQCAANPCPAYLVDSLRSTRNSRRRQANASPRRTGSAKAVRMDQSPL